MHTVNTSRIAFPLNFVVAALVALGLLGSFYEVIGRMTREVGSLFDGR